MAFTFSPDLADDISKVRDLIGDVDSTDPLLQDETISYLITQEDNIYAAAARASERIAARVARYGSVSADGVSVSTQEMYDRYMAMAKMFDELDKSSGVVTPYVGGVSWREVDEDANNPDLIQLHIKSHIHDHPDYDSDAQT